MGPDPTARSRSRLAKIERMAERAGFEPAVPFPTHALSKRVPSAAQTPLRRELKSKLAEVAERGGFEPPVHHKYTLVFETSPISRSGTSPCCFFARRQPRPGGCAARMAARCRACSALRSAPLAKELLQELARFIGAHALRALGA